MVNALIEAGLGLDKDTIRLSPASEGWIHAGSALRDDVTRRLDGIVTDVEQVGSSSVVGMLAKPVIDLAVGVPADHDLGLVTSRLEDAGWVYRGDAGEHGGHVFVLEARPGHRVAHLHVVVHGGQQWRDYLRLRDLLRASPDACRRYGAVKARLAESCGDDRAAYTDGKSDVVRSLLRISAGSTSEAGDDARG